VSLHYSFQKSIHSVDSNFFYHENPHGDMDVLLCFLSCTSYALSVILKKLAI